MAILSLIITLACIVYKGFEADKWRPQGDSNPCCRRERAVS